MPEQNKSGQNFDFQLTVAADCRLQGYSRQLMDALKQQLTIDNPKYKDAKKYGRWVGKRIKPKLQFYAEGKNYISFPRGFTRKALRLCQQHLGQLPRIVDNRRLLPECPFQFNGLLRPYQKAAVNDVLKHHFGVLVAGTGSGKTIMALYIIAVRKQPVLILLHNKELMYQWRDRVEEFLGIEPGLIGDGQFNIQPVSIAIVNTARKRLKELACCFGHLIVDECHRVPASLFTNVVTAFDCQYTLGLSATAYRREDGLTKLIYYFMGDRTHEIDQRMLTASGAVLEPEFIQQKTNFEYRFRGDYQALMTALTSNDARNQQIATDIAAEAKSGIGSILVVSDRINHCETISNLLSSMKIESKILTGKVSADQRAEIVNGVRHGEVKILISTLQLVGEGFDAQDLTTLFLTTPIKFSGRLRQIIGRILRPSKGKKAKVIDYADHKVGVLNTSAQTRLKIYSLKTKTSLFDN